MTTKAQQHVLICGAAGRDFHNFNVRFRDDPRSKVVAFTATQIPGIDGRRYPAQLAGEHYPHGIPIEDEARLEALVAELAVDRVVFAYSDVTHEHVMQIASRAMAAGADFWLLGPTTTMIASRHPVVSVCAVRTGSGKSQTSRYIAQWLRDRGIRVAAIRHPMPYGDLVAQRVQRFGELRDLDLHDCTIEEREEYEPYLALGIPIFAGVDYGAILEQAEAESELILWDGGNNDWPFYRPDLEIVVCDPHRVGHEQRYHPGETNVRRADVLIVNKVDSATPASVATLRETLGRMNPGARIVSAASELSTPNPDAVRGKRVLCIEDGPTLTHGEMAFGAAEVLARRLGAKEIVDPRPAAVGSIRRAFERYPTLGLALPALGYGETQLRELEQSIAAADCDLVLIGTPIDLARTIAIEKPHQRVFYRYQDSGEPTLSGILEGFAASRGLTRR
ncbi:MAG: hypothetical protein KC609_06225 [Myxococcales bacterium]|nr:hypothetical protein [Myxococcales bacterium]